MITFNDIYGKIRHDSVRKHKSTMLTFIRVIFIRVTKRLSKSEFERFHGRTPDPRRQWKVTVSLTYSVARPALSRPRSRPTLLPSPHPGVNCLFPRIIFTNVPQKQIFLKTRQVRYVFTEVTMGSQTYRLLKSLQIVAYCHVISTFSQCHLHGKMKFQYDNKLFFNNYKVYF